MAHLGLANHRYCTPRVEGYRLQPGAIERTRDLWEQSWQVETPSPLIELFRFRLGLDFLVNKSIIAWITRCEETAMPLSPDSFASTLLVLFIPSHDRDEQPIDHEFWVKESLTWLGQSLGGATAFPQGRGVWRDDTRGGRLLFDDPTIVQCYTTEEALEEHVDGLNAYLIHMGSETRQAAVAYVINNLFRSFQVP